MIRRPPRSTLFPTRRSSDLLETLIVSDILPSQTTELAHYLLPGCAHAEKRGTFTNIKGRVQKLMKAVEPRGDARPDRKSTRLNSSHLVISYAVFCLKKKKNT